MPSVSSQTFQNSSQARKNGIEKIRHITWLKNFTSGQKNVSDYFITKRTIDKYSNVYERSAIYTGIPNEIATKLVLMLMGFISSLVFLCIFLLIAVYIHYKEKSDEHFTANKANMKIDKVHSPYIITPEQKITQQLLSAQMITSIECSANDIAQLLRYIALYGEFKEDEIHRTSRTFIRLVSRGKTKFDEGDFKKEQETRPKLGSKLDFHCDQQTSTAEKKSRKRMHHRDISSSKPRKKARKKELSDELDCDSGAKRSSKKGNAMKKDRKEENEKKNSESKLSHQLVEASPYSHGRLSNKLQMKGKKRKHLKDKQMKIPLDVP
ncbi:hypothetical protein ACH3XW_22025 [Acanthocheilonema viteae]